MRMETLQTLTPAPWAPIFAIECRLTDNCSFSKGPCLQTWTSIALFSGEKTIQHQSKQSHIPKPGAAAAHSKPHIVRSKPECLLGRLCILCLDPQNIAAAG